MRTSWGSATDTGRVRSLNEDALLAYPPVFLVADGMGGHAAGDVASRVVVEEFRQLAGRPAVVADDVHACIRSAARRLRAELGQVSAGTTVAGVAVAEHDDGAYWLVFNVGDSRVYRLAGGALEQISVDHSVVQELLDAGAIDAAQAGDHPERHVVTRAVGTGRDPEPDYWLLPAGPTDRLLVCSDGLTTELSDDEIGRLLRAEDDPQAAAGALVDAALRAGGNDNVTVVVVDVAVSRTVAEAAEAGNPAPAPATTPAEPPRPSVDDVPDEDTQPRPPSPEVPR